MTLLARRALSALTSAALLAGLFLGAPASARATPETYYVGHLVNDYAPGSECANPDYWTDGDWTGGGEYDSDNDAIQDAADNAASGSVIYICAGTYVFAEQVTVAAGVSLTFRGEGDETLLDGSGDTRIFNSNAAQSTDQGGVLSLRDLLIIDAKVTSSNGGAIESDGLSLNNVTITGSTGAYNGGALYAEGNVTIMDSTFTDNISIADGGVLYAWGGVPVSISNSVFYGSTAGFTGAIDATIATVTGSTFRNNSGDYGGAIDADIATVTDSAFTKNTVTVYGGAIYATTAIVSSSSFTDNEADVEGGAILAGPGTIITRSRFTRNTAGEHGGAMLLYAPNSADLQQLRGNTFMRNTAPAGGAITLGPCTVPSRSEATRVERANRFSGNRATEQRRTQNIERWEGGCG